MAWYPNSWAVSVAKFKYSGYFQNELFCALEFSNESKPRLKQLPSKTTTLEIFH